MEDEKKPVKTTETNTEETTEEVIEEPVVEPKVDEDAEVDKLVASFVKKVQSQLEVKKEKIVETKEQMKTADLSPEEKTKEFITALVTNDRAKLKVMSEGTNADGGFLVPNYWYMQIVEEMRDYQVIRNMSTVIPNCPKQLNITQLVGRPISSFRAEKALKDTSTATFAQIALTPYSLACIVTVTNELIQDAEVGGSIISLLTRLIAQSITEREEKAFAVGTGTTEPTGINAYSATTHRIVATPANVATADTLIQAFYKLGQRYRGAGAWLMPSATLTVVRQLKDSQNRYLFIPDPNNAVAGTILGRPVYEQNDLPVGIIWFGDFKGYWIGDRGGLSIAQSEEATITGVGNLFEQNMVAIRVEKRVDAELADLDALVYISGNN